MLISNLSQQISINKQYPGIDAVNELKSTVNTLEDKSSNETFGYIAGNVDSYSKSIAQAENLQVSYASLVPSTYKTEQAMVNNFMNITENQSSFESITNLNQYLTGEYKRLNENGSSSVNTLNSNLDSTQNDSNNLTSNLLGNSSGNSAFSMAGSVTQNAINSYKLSNFINQLQSSSNTDYSV